MTAAVIKPELRLRIEILNSKNDSLVYRDYWIDEDGNAPRLLTDEVQDLLDTLRDINKPL